MKIKLVVLSVLLLIHSVSADSTGKMILLCITLSFLHTGHKPFTSDSSPTAAIVLRALYGVLVALFLALFKFPLASFAACSNRKGFWNLNGETTLKGRHVATLNMTSLSYCTRLMLSFRRIDCGIEDIYILFFD